MKRKIKDMVKAANDLGHTPIAQVMLPMAGSIAATPGLLCAANDASFTSAFFSDPLTNYLVGWRDPNATEELLEYLAPMVPTGRRYEFKRITNAEQFLQDPDDVRAMYADFKTVRYSGDTQLGQTKNKGLTIFIDRDLLVKSGSGIAIPMVEERYTAWLWQRTLRTEIVRCVTGLLGLAQAVGKTWGSSADPDSDLLNALDTAGDSAGFEPNRIIFGRTAWIKRQTSIRSQLTAGSLASAPLSMVELAGWLGVDDIRQIRGRYQATTTTKSKILGASVIGYFAEAGQMTDDPSNIKRMVSECEGGGYKRVYRREASAKLIEITVEHYSDIVIPTTLGAFVLTIS